MFVEKARKIQAFGAIGGIILDNQAGTNARLSPVFAMSGDGKDDIKIPLVFLFTEDGDLLTNALKEHPDLVVSLCDFNMVLAEAVEQSNETWSEVELVRAVQQALQGLEANDLLQHRTKVRHVLAKLLDQQRLGDVAGLLDKLQDLVHVTSRRSCSAPTSRLSSPNPATSIQAFLAFITKGHPDDSEAS